MNFKTFVFMILTFRRVDPIPKNIGLMLSITFWISIVWIISNFANVIYKNGMELLVVLSYDHNEPCKGCFFYKNKACGSEKLIKCWDCKKEYIFTAIRKYNTTELCGIVKRYEETYKIILKTIKKIEKECQKYVIWDTVHVMLKDDGELIIKALSKDKSVLLNDFIIYVNNNGSIDEEDYDLLLTK